MTRRTSAAAAVADQFRRLDLKDRRKLGDDLQPRIARGLFLLAQTGAIEDRRESGNNRGAASGIDLSVRVASERSPSRRPVYSRRTAFRRSGRHLGRHRSVFSRSPSPPVPAARRT